MFLSLICRSLDLKLFSLMSPKALSRLFLGLLSFIVSTGFLSAQEERREVEVRSTRFDLTRPTLGDSGDDWLEAEVELNVNGSADPTKLNPRYVDNVLVVLSLSFEVSGSTGETELRFYQAEAEMPTLDSTRYTVRFYLPPEVVDRDGLRSRPHAYLVDLFVDGRRQVPARANMDPLLFTDSVRESFRLRIARDAPDNDGVLLPVYLTPFAHQYPRETPSFIRRAPGR